jgi:hypothetical protein
MNLEKIQTAWLEFKRQTQLERPRTDDEYQNLYKLMQALTNKYTTNDPVWSPLIRLVAQYMLEWENENGPQAIEATRAETKRRSLYDALRPGILLENDEVDRIFKRAEWVRTTKTLER